MVGKNNRFLKNSQNGQKYQRFSLRKLSIGVVSVAIAAGFYFDNLTSVQADTVASGNNQAVVANQGSQTNVNSQSVVLGSAAQTVESTTPEQSSAPASTAATSTSSQGSMALQKDAAAPGVESNQNDNEQAKQVSDDQAQSVSLHMYTYTSAADNTSSEATISDNKSQLVGITGSFEITEEQLENDKLDSITIGTIKQQRDQDGLPNIPVLIRTSQHSLTIPGTNIKIGDITITHVGDKTSTSDVVLKLVNINRDIKIKNYPGLTFTIPIAFDLNHGADASEYPETSWNKNNTQKVNFLLNGQDGENLYQLTIKRPILTSKPKTSDFTTYKDLEDYLSQNPFIYPHPSSDEAVFSVRGDYISPEKINEFLNDPLKAQANISDENYQWHLTIKEDSKTNNIANIQVSGGAPLGLMFDLQNNGKKTGVVSLKNTGAVPLWENIQSIRTFDNLDFSDLQSLNYEGLVWSHQKDNSIKLWFNWPKKKLHDEWVKAIESKYHGSDSDYKEGDFPKGPEAKDYCESLANYFKKAMYTTTLGVDADEFAKNNANAYYHFLGTNPLMWYQEIHIISQNPLDMNRITADAGSRGIAHIKTIPGTHNVQALLTRTITVTMPGGITKKPFEQQATYDDKQPKGVWEEYKLPEIPGYTPVIHSNIANEEDKSGQYEIPKVDFATLAKKDIEELISKGNQYLYVTYQANPQSMNINYVDAQGNKIATFKVSGKTDQTVDTNAKIPTGWVLVPGQTDAPAQITFGGTPTANITVKIQHGTTNVPHDNPVKPGDKTPTGKVIDGAYKSDLNMMITRTINVTDPVSGKTTTTKQDAKLFRDATVDNVTGEVTYGAWSTASWDDFKPAAIDGYTVSQDDVAQTAVTSDTKPVTINITYTANDQTGKIVYVDVDNNNTEVGYTDLTGKTGADVTIAPQIPAGFDQVAGQKIPTSVKVGADSIPTVTVKVQHHKITVKPGDEPKPGDKKPANPGKKPGDGTPNKDISYEDLHKSTTRTITIHDPHNGNSVDKETINFNRIATIDDVTGDVTYGNWMVAPDSTQDRFNNITYPIIPGYTMTATPGDHSAKILSQADINNWTDPNITVNYTANAQNQVVNYVDDSGKIVKSDTLNGKTGDQINIAVKVPAHYVEVPGQTIPENVTLKTNNPAINIRVTPKMDDITDPSQLTKTVSRTVTINVPHQTPIVENQTATFTRTGQHNEVTGEDTFTDWTLSNNGLKSVNVPSVDGYTPS